ncbi:IclR family transcriptional regulator [Plantactinospora soyae]|uniref:Glycerol operon regulatory protein n=1 Tax=Plantactinospora soyae TaxID=1544732 RepID=A0A927M5F6_9ACTN|nr:IclR family transcriptional regulator [Plantactinospora soyae]MBE1488508.1 IclR family pca regulon transcriptional regulator [Plantactinospora soyae]
MTETQSRSPEFVQSLERGLAVIRVFDAEHPELTLSDVARAADLTRAAARRFLLTLVELGYVRSDGRLFALRPRILELGYAYLSSLNLPEVALPHLESLVAQVHESCSVSVLDGDEVVYIARVPTHRIMTVAISVGTRFPAYATSMGRVLLAAQPEQWLDGYLGRTELRPMTRRTITDPERLRSTLHRVRSQGFALVDQELEEGLRSIAVPIQRPDGSVAAAMNLSAHVSRGSSESIRRELLPALLDTAKVLQQDLRVPVRSPNRTR